MLRSALSVFVLILLRVSIYGRIFCQESLWIFCSKKLIWSEPKGLLLCLGCFLATAHVDSFQSNMFSCVHKAAALQRLKLFRKHNKKIHIWVRSRHGHKHCNVIFSCGALLSVCHRCGFCLPRPNALSLCPPSHRTLQSQVSPVSPQKVFS